MGTRYQLFGFFFQFLPQSIVFLLLRLNVGFKEGLCLGVDMIGGSRRKGADEVLNLVFILTLNICKFGLHSTLDLLDVLLCLVGLLLLGQELGVGVVKLRAWRCRTWVFSSLISMSLARSFSRACVSFVLRSASSLDWSS